MCFNIVETMTVSDNIEICFKVKIVTLFYNVHKKPAKRSE